jgi:hypothetical protein
MTTDMEDFDTLLVISLNGYPREEHMRYLSKSESCMRIDEINFRWSDIYIPLSEIGTHQNQQIDNV